MSIGEEVYELADILYKNKEYNLLWHDCIYLADQIVERIHSMGKSNIKTTDWLTRGMTREQIAREKQEAIMAADLELCYAERMGVSKFYPDYDAIAERMYEIGYRKQNATIKEIFTDIDTALEKEAFDFGTRMRIKIFLKSLKQKYLGGNDDEMQ